MKPPSLVLRLDLGPTWPDVVYRHPAKIAERTAPVKAEMNGLSPGLDRRRRPAEWVDKADNPILCLSADKVIVGLLVLSKLKWAGKPF